MRDAAPADVRPAGRHRRRLAHRRGRKPVCAAARVPGPAAGQEGRRRARSSCRPSSCSTSTCSPAGWTRSGPSAWTGRCKIIAGVGPVRSLRALDFMRSEVPGMHVPDDVVRRLRGVPADQVARPGPTLCAETIQRLSGDPGVAGVHVMAFGCEQGVPEIIERAGIGRPGCRRRYRGGPTVMLIDFRPHARLRGPEPRSTSARRSARCWTRWPRHRPTSAGSGWCATGCSTGRTSATSSTSGRSCPARHRREADDRPPVAGEGARLRHGDRRRPAARPGSHSKELAAARLRRRPGRRVAAGGLGAGQPQLIWGFNALYWKALALWEQADRQELRAGAARRRERRPQSSPPRAS